MAAADMAMWLAIMTKIGRVEMAVTAEMKTSFLNGAKREGFYSTARTLKVGRRLIFGAAESVNGDGTLLAHHSFTYARPDM
jgi:acyl-coenzyme A thioesterase PaaI-like protein